MMLKLTPGDKLRVVCTGNRFSCDVGQIYTFKRFNVVDSDIVYVQENLKPYTINKKKFGLHTFALVTPVGPYIKKKSVTVKLP
jgi:hypothetical protein